MKILIVRTFPDILNLNSYNVQEVGLAKALTLKDHRCDIVLYHGKQADRCESYEFEHEGKKYCFSIYWLKGYGLFKNGFMPSVKKLIADYDVIQVHEYDQIMSWMLYTRQKKPTVIYHGPYYGEYAKGYNLKCKVFDRLFLKRRRYENVVTVTKSKLATVFLREKGFRQVITAGVGINADNFGESNITGQGGNGHPKNTDGSKNSKNLLYVGKLEERRNVYFLVDVFRELHRRDSKLRLTLIGSGEKEYQERFLQEIRSELEQGSIQYVEKATQKELAEYYKQSSVFLFASNYEIFGMVLLEAMHFGVPVISSRNGGSTTLIENGLNGYVMDKFNQSEWSECIEGLLCDPEKLTQMGMHAQQTIREQFTWNALADKFVNAYELAVKEFERM